MVIVTKLPSLEAKTWFESCEVGTENSNKKTLKYACSEATKVYNINKNRFKGIYSYDHNRVSIRKELEDKIEGSTYINASHIHLSNFSNRYLATQAPLPETFHDFWLMVYEFRSPIILVLSKEFEGNVAKYQCYWPKTVGERILHFQDNLQVELLKENQHPSHADVTMAYLKVYQTTDLKEVNALLVTQIRFDNWPDMGVPSSPSIILALINIFHSELIASQAKNSKASNVPTIHCSAGVGRTGTFCAIDSGLSLLKHWDMKTDMVLYLIQQLRQQRMLAVETYQQFCFVYQCIHYFQHTNIKG